MRRRSASPAIQETPKRAATKTPPYLPTDTATGTATAGTDPMPATMVTVLPQREVPYTTAAANASCTNSTGALMTTWYPPINQARARATPGHRRPRPTATAVPATMGTIVPRLGNMS
ncbi:hypothetical protein AB0L88_17445 [Saccharopolyspora shandongensis]|uniref:hypothetical protein n=1 Tax=Saccharopolyspora shandongensis TaxID=418495 RepID=UPI00343A4C9F